MLKEDERVAIYLEGHLHSEYGKMGIGAIRYLPNKIVAVIDSKNAGSDPVYDNFWYTISDGNSTDTAVLQIKIIFPAVTGGGNENVTDPTPDGDDDTETETESDNKGCLLYTSPSPRDQRGSGIPS